jgi:hypothetical protein
MRVPLSGRCLSPEICIYATTASGPAGCWSQRRSWHITDTSLVLYTANLEMLKARYHREILYVFDAAAKVYGKLGGAL